MIKKIFINELNIITAFVRNIIQQILKNVYTFLKICDKIFKTIKKFELYKVFLIRGIYFKEVKMKFNKDTKIGEILQVAPEKAEVLMECGMHCIGCPASQMETLEEACAVHGIDVNEVIEKLNA